MKLNHRFIKVLLAAALAGAAMLPAGCGNSLDDQFVFGKNRVHCNNATITVATPFELVWEGKQVDLSPLSSDTVAAQGQNAHLQILVTGNKVSSDKNEKLLTEEASQVLSKDTKLSNLKSSSEPFTVGDTKGTKLNFTFTDNSRGRHTNLTVDDYIFTQNDTVWRVIYQYRTDDPVGKELAGRLSGKIALGSEF